MNIQTLETTVHIGKAGITDTVVAQIKQQLRKNKAIKIRYLTSAIKTTKKEFLTELVEKTKTKLKQHVGFTAVLARMNAK